MKRFITLLKSDVRQAINDFCNRYLPPDKEKTTISFPAIFNKEEEKLEQIDIHISRTTPYFYLTVPYGTGSQSYLHLVRDKEGIHSFGAFTSHFYPSQISLFWSFEYRIEEIVRILENSYIFLLLEKYKLISKQEKEKVKKKEKEIEELKQQNKKMEEEIFLFKKQQLNVDDFLSFYFKSCFPACGVIKDYKTLKEVIQKMFNQYKEANHAD